MKRIKKLVAIILAITLLSSTTAMVFANSSEDIVDNATTCSSDNEVCSAEEVDLSQGGYAFVVEDGKGLYSTFSG